MVRKCVYSLEGKRKGRKVIIDQYKKRERAKIWKQRLETKEFRRMFPTIPKKLTIKKICK